MALFDGIPAGAADLERTPLPAIPHRFVVVSHQGSHLKQAPENSLQSIDAAIAEGAEYVEMDIRRTRNGVHFLMHDSKPRRMAPEGPDRPLSELSWAGAPGAETEGTGRLTAAANDHLHL